MYLPVPEKMLLRDWLTGRKWWPCTLKGEFVCGYEAGHPGWKTLCHKPQVSWFDIWQLHTIPAVFSCPNLPAVQLKMEMIYVPQRLTDWQAMQETVVGPHCDCGTSKSNEKWWDHRDTPSAGIREISLTQKVELSVPRHGHKAGLWFLLKLKKKCTTPKSIYFSGL